MSPEDLKAYEEYFDLFSRPGWTRLVEDLSESLDVVLDIRNAKDEKDLFTNQGKADVLKQIVTLQETMDRLYQEYSDDL